MSATIGALLFVAGGVLGLYMGHQVDASTSHAQLRTCLAYASALEKDSAAAVGGDVFEALEGSVIESHK